MEHLKIWLDEGVWQLSTDSELLNGTRARGNVEGPLTRALSVPPWIT